jgi:hypothetical protein
MCCCLIVTSYFHLLSDKLYSKIKDKPNRFLFCSSLFFCRLVLEVISAGQIILLITKNRCNKIGPTGGM